MPKAKAVGSLQYWKVAVEIHTPGQLHATSPQNPQGIEYMLKRQPSQGVLEARVAAGEPITPMEELTEQVETEVGAEVGAPAAVFRRDEEDRPFIHPNFVKGHLREASSALSRVVNFWGFQDFINKTLFVRPERIYFTNNPEVQKERWPTHFDIYRMGRVSSFREAEYVADSRVAFSLFLVNDPRWTAALLNQLFQYGSLRGWGGGRGRSLGQYEFTLSEWTGVAPEEVWS